MFGEPTPSLLACKWWS